MLTLKSIASASRGWWTVNDACAAALIGILVAAFCAIQSRRNAQRRREVGTEDPPPGIGLRLFIVVAVIAVLATYACLLAVRHHLRGAVMPPVSADVPSPSPTAIDLAIEAAFDEAALLRHVHRGSPGF